MLTRDNFKQYMHEIENYESTVMDLYSNYKIETNDEMIEKYIK